MIAMAKAKLELIAPFPPEAYPELFRWFIQTPDKMLDDFAPHTIEDLSQIIAERSKTEYTCMVTENGTPVGYIGFQELSPHVGSLRGVCFDQKVHGNGTALRALRVVLQQQFDRGIYKIMAFPFADNARSCAFYKKLGAVEEGYLKNHTLRDGKMVDMFLMAFFAPHDGYPSYDSV